MRECIRSSKKAAQDMDDFQIKICKVQQPLGLTAVEVLGLMEICQVFVVSEDLDREQEAVEVVSP